MADRNIVTQVGIEDLKFQLTEIAENLSSHVNASLSKAHGINVIQGYTDAYGNDLSSYQDSNGDILSNYFLRFSIDNVVYYAPAKSTVLDGQPETAGSIDTSPEGEFENQGGSAWITNYTSDQVAQAESINTDVLVQHTRQPHATTHGGLTVVVKDTLTILGHKAGTHVIQFKVGNAVYEIPCSTRLGGPPQPPRIGGINPNPYSHFSPGSSNKVNEPLTPALYGGTLPVAYHWQYNDNGTWTDIEPSASGFIVPPGWERLEFTWPDTSTVTFRITEAKPGSNNVGTVQFRCRVTNLAVPDAGTSSGVLTNVSTYVAADET